MSDRPFAPMKNILFMFVACVVLATPCLSAPDRYTTDKPSPLKLAKPGKEQDGPVHFRGQVQISGRFLIGWEIINRNRQYLRVLFRPDKESAALLPYAAGSGPVKELLLSNSEQAVSLLLDAASAQRILAKELIDAEGEATGTIHDYSTVVECDHRWYMAHLVSASKSEKIVIGARERNSVGC
jgi:hypothetical protein